MSCRGCVYKAYHNAGYKCDYLLIIGHSRGCPIEGCTVKETKGGKSLRERQKIRLPGSPPPLNTRTAHRTREYKPGVRVTFDETKALELYHQGLTDRQIAAGLDNVVTKHGIRAWRGRKGLKRVGSGKPIQKEAVMT